MSYSMWLLPIFMYEWTQVKMNIEMDKGDRSFGKYHANGYGHVFSTMHYKCKIGFIGK